MVEKKEESKTGGAYAFLNQDDEDEEGEADGQS